MKRMLFAALLSSAICGLMTSSVQANPWVFQRSYYSHNPVVPIQVGPRSYGGPYYTRTQGDYVRSGFRHNQSWIQIPGATFDMVNSWESWIQHGSQW